ncbi:MAG: DUF423 domain-containing protein [Planctomycetota bacterium]
MQRDEKRWWVAGAVLGFLAVLTGAFGSHGLKPLLAPLGAAVAAKRMEVWEIACRYAAFHALALLGTGALAARARGGAVTVAGAGFFLGTIVFSGTLWLYGLTGARWLGMITPLGGLGLLVAWCALAYAAARAPGPEVAPGA